MRLKNKKTALVTNQKAMPERYLHAPSPKLAAFAHLVFLATLLRKRTRGYSATAGTVIPNGQSRRQPFVPQLNECDARSSCHCAGRDTAEE